MHDRGVIYDGAHARLIACLNDIEDELRVLLALLKPLAEAEQVPAEATCDEIRRRFNAFEDLLPAMDEALASSDHLAAEASTTARRLRGALETARARASFLNEVPTRTDPAHVRGDATETTALLVTALDEVRTFVLPYRVKCRLRGMSVGRSLDFKAEFSAEIPSIDERKALLEEFARRRDYFDEAVIDVTNELIWRKSSNATWRYVTAYAFPVLFTVLVGALLCLPGLFGFDYASLDETGDVLLAYLLVFTGAVGHLLIENVKQAQSRTRSITAIGEATDWLHLRWVGLAWSFFPIVVVVVGLLAIGTDVREQESALMFFFAGYSVDSVAGLFLTRFGTAAGAGVDELSTLVGRTQA